MGGYTSERAGVINIGLEGMMLMAAAVTALVSFRSGAVLGVTAGVTSAIGLAMLHWLATQKYRIDHVISGMAINAIAAGGTNFLWGKFGDSSQAGTMPHLNLWTFYTVAIALPAVLWWVSGKTRAGLHLIAVGADPDKARLMGLRPLRVRLIGLLATGVFAGIAGAVLVTDAETFTDNMTAGRGYIALAALIVGGWRPIPAALICLAFGFFSSLQLQFQGTQTLAFIPSQAWASMPYVVTIIALAGFLGRNRTPAGLGRP
jgi:simple sugar transport system permease protein